MLGILWASYKFSVFSEFQEAIAHTTRDSMFQAIECAMQRKGEKEE